MRTAFKGLVAAAALAATGVVATQPARAQDTTGIAVAAGVVGLGLGAAIASADQPGFSQVQYYRGGYPAYGYGGGYYARPSGYAYGYGDRGYYRGDDRRWRHHHRDRWNDGWRGRGWRDRDWRRNRDWR